MAFFSPSFFNFFTIIKNGKFFNKYNNQHRIYVVKKKASNTLCCHFKDDVKINIQKLEEEGWLCPPLNNKNDMSLNPTSFVEAESPNLGF